MGMLLQILGKLCKTCCGKLALRFWMGCKAQTAAIAVLWRGFLPVRTVAGRLRAKRPLVFSRPRRGAHAGAGNGAKCGFYA